MSLDDEKRAVVVGLEMQKAYDTLEEAILLADNGRWSGAANRLYYAVFHAVSALLIHDAHPVKSHKGAGIQFNQYYIKPVIINSRYGALYARLESMREEGDYNCHYAISKEELHGSIAPAKDLIAIIAEMVKK